MIRFIVLERGKIKIFDITRKQYSRIIKLFEDSNGVIWLEQTTIMKIKTVSQLG